MTKSFVVTVTINEMNAAIEKGFVIAAKMGNFFAQKRLFNIYLDEIECAHQFSGAGLMPKKFGYGYNYNGVAYANYTLELYQVFLKALRKYDFSLAGKAAKLPFLNYLRNEIQYRALDKVKADKTAKDRGLEIICASDYVAKRYGNDSTISNCDALDIEASNHYIYSGDAQDKFEKDIKEVMDKVRACTKEGSEQRKFLDTALEVAESQDKNIMETVAKKVSGSNAKRTAMYYIQKTTRKFISKDAEEMFFDVLKNAA